MANTSSHKGKINAQLDDELLEAYFGKNSEKYMEKYKLFVKDGNFKFHSSWNVHAFLFQTFWLAYRKIYALAIILNLTPLGLIPVCNILCGFMAYYIYFKKAIKDINTLKQKNPTISHEQLLLKVKKKGGSNISSVTDWIFVTIFIIEIFIISIIKNAMK